MLHLWFRNSFSRRIYELGEIPFCHRCALYLWDVLCRCCATAVLLYQVRAARSWDQSAAGSILRPSDVALTPRCWCCPLRVFAIISFRCRTAALPGTPGRMQVGCGPCSWRLFSLTVTCLFGILCVEDYVDLDDWMHMWWRTLVTSCCPYPHGRR